MVPTCARRNPTVLLLLFVPDGEVVYRTRPAQNSSQTLIGSCLSSRLIGTSGTCQLQQCGDDRRASAHTNRPELVAVHGYDTKYAMHALRLGIQGVELLRSGRITLSRPRTIPQLPALGAARRGPAH